MAINFGPSGSGYLVTTSTTTIGCTPGYLTDVVTKDYVDRQSRTNLTPAQIAFLLSEHRFIPMDDDGSGFCLFCFALDVYRRKIEHLFVITEE